MVIKYPDVSKDFPKLIRTLASLETDFDYWDDLVMKIYQNSDKPGLNLESYFKKMHWIHLEKPYPTCPEIEDDWLFLKNRHIKHVGGTKYRVDLQSLLNSPLKEYAINEDIPNLITAQ